MARAAALRVLHLTEGATRAAIKGRFRELAKAHHPDIVAARDGGCAATAAVAEAHIAMSEIAAAYSALTEHETPGRFTGSWSNRVAWSCESFTLEDLRGDDVHDVHGILLELDGSGMPVMARDESRAAAERRRRRSRSRGDALAPPLLHMHAHPMDSVLDLKRAVQSAPDAARWWGERGLDARVSSADGVAEAFEVILPRRSAVGDVMRWSREEDADASVECRGGDGAERNGASSARGGSAERGGGTKHALLSNHFFLDDYGMHGGTESLVYAVIGRPLDRARGER
jgi:hypothetical protein